jgi:formate-dependent nitrite reductase membrane component NrfD
MLLETANDHAIPAGQCWLLAGFLVLLLVAIGAHLRTGADTPGKAESTERLTRGMYRTEFVGGVVVVGTVVPLVAAVLAAAVPSARDAIGIICFVLLLPAGFFLRLLTLRVGIFPPVRSLVPVR